MSSPLDAFAQGQEGPEVDTEVFLRALSAKDNGPRTICLHGWDAIIVRRFVTVEDSEVQPVIRAFFSFLMLMAAYFLCMPLRDEAGMSLGTGALPFLFLGSLLVTIIAAPASSALLTHPDISKGRALLLLYRFFAASLLFFFCVYIIVPANSKMGTERKESLGDLGAFSDVPISFRIARASFFLWVALFNLFTVSAMWARLADAMSSEAAGRLFGFIGAGATGGQLLGSLLASGLAGGGPGLLIIAAILMELAGRCALKISEDNTNYVSISNQDLDSSEESFKETNQTSTSKSNLEFRKSPKTLRKSKLSFEKNREDNSNQGAGIEGLVKQGTEGDTERERERVKERESIEDSIQGEKDTSPLHMESIPLLNEEVLLDGEKMTNLKGRTASSIKRERDERGKRGERGVLGLNLSQRSGFDPVGESSSPSKSVLGKGGGVTFRAGPNKVLEGISLILQSSYLLQICFFLLMTAIISSFFYFERATVVAGSSVDPIARRRMLANINSVSAVATILFQLTLTGRLLSVCGVAVALSSSPFMALLGMVAIAVYPSPTVVAISEAVRKVVNYVLTRPGREMLFTVVSQEEKYKAKVTIDTLVQRLGDAVAAGVFRVLGSGLKLGPSGVAAFSVPLCVLWLISGFLLGLRQQSMALTRRSNPRAK